MSIEAKPRPYTPSPYPVARDHPEYHAHKSAWAAVGVDIEPAAPLHTPVPAPPVDRAEREIFRLITNEVARARNLVPGRTDMFVALTEEVGQLAQALIDQKYKAARNDTQFHLNVLAEAVQVAAMAVRIATEGDAGFNYEPPPEIQFGPQGTGDYHCCQQHPCVEPRIVPKNWRCRVCNFGPATFTEMLEHAKHVCEPTQPKPLSDAARVVTGRNKSDER